MTYDLQILYNQVALLQKQIQCLKTQMDLCCEMPSPPINCTAISITSQPQGGSINTGGSITLSVTATGDPTLLYQWKKNGVNLSGATSSSYAIITSLLSDGGSYTVAITNPCGTVVSNPAVVSVTNPVTQATFRYGYTALTPDLIDVALIGGLQHSVTQTTGLDVTADFTDNSSPKYLIMAEPSTEPTKTKWYGADLNKGNIGTDQDLFPAPLTVGSYRVYVTAYPTQQTDTTIIFKII